MELYSYIARLTYITNNFRVAKENRVLAGLWHGPLKPDMGLFLKPMTDSLHKLSTEG